MKPYSRLLVILVLFLACIPGAETAEIDNETRYCVAIRGNGGRGAAHISALAKSHEQYGLLWGIAGTSSGSVVSFIVDSIYGNPLLYDCDGTRCTPQETAARAALLMKSELNRSAALVQFPESSAFFLFFRIEPILKQLKVEQLLNDDPAAGLATLRAIVSDPRIKTAVNQEILELLDRSPKPVEVAKDIVKGLVLGSEFKFDNATTFIRPGIVSYPALSEFLGRVGDFYALEKNFSDKTGMNNYLKACATPGRGKPWTEVRDLPAGDSTCGKTYVGLIQNYYRAAIASGQPSKRLDQPVGTNLHTLVANAVIVGQSAERWRQARQAYVTGTPMEWAPTMEDLRIGFFGRAADLDRLHANPLHFDDIKTQKHHIFKNQTWRQVLQTSPAEPSVSRGVELPTKDPEIALGGWVELHPVQPLLNIGCQEVVLQTTEGSILDSYSDQVLSLFNPTQTERNKFYSFSNAESSVAQALKKATGIKCIEYDQFPITDVDGLGNIGWNAPFLTHSPFFTNAKNPDPNIVSRFSKKGCAPGVAD